MYGDSIARDSFVSDMFFFCYRLFVSIQGLSTAGTGDSCTGNASYCYLNLSFFSFFSSFVLGNGVY